MEDEGGLVGIEILSEVIGDVVDRAIGMMRMEQGLEVLWL